MSMEYLGESFDMHSGGVDLIFPHHENEIAQSEAATGKTFCHHWMHVAHLMVDGEKMAKSKANFFKLDELDEQGYSGAEVRYVLLSAFYRQPLNFVATNETGDRTFPSLDGAKSALTKLSKFAEALQERAPGLEEPTYDSLVASAGSIELGPFAGAFDALLDDLNTPAAFGQLFSALKSVKPAEADPAEAESLFKALHFVVAALGLELPDLEAEKGGDVPDEVRELAEKRWQAKQDKDWGAADQLRDQISEMGWQVKDTKDGFELSPA